MSTLHLFSAATLLTSCLAFAATIPAARGTALDGHSVTLPNDLAPRATILIVGFSRNSADATTAWEKRVRAELAPLPGIGFYDMPMLAEVPSLIRPLVLRSLRKQVPDVLRPRFVPITTDLKQWKQVAMYAEAAPDAAYVLLVDARGSVLWQTHDAFSTERLTELATATRKLSQ